MGKKVYNFSGCDKLAKIGEAVSEEYLHTLKFINKIENVRDVKEYQAKDIDIIAEIDTRKIYIEVKTDSYTSGNMFYETISNDIKQEIGCMEKTEADFIFYYFINPKYRKIYIFRTEMLRDWVHKNKERFKLKKVYNYSYNSFGYAFPLDILVEEIKNGIKIIDLNCLEDISKFEEAGKKYWNKE